MPGQTLFCLPSLPNISKSEIVILQRKYESALIQCKRQKVTYVKQRPSNNFLSKEMKDRDDIQEQLFAFFNAVDKLQSMQV